MASDRGGGQLLEKEFRDKLGDYGEDPEVNKVLNGTLVSPDSATVSTKDCLQAYQQHENIHLLTHDTDIVNRYKNNLISWKKRSESIATYGHRIGHFQAAAIHNF